jgi:HK97 family phage major capsid protein
MRATDQMLAKIAAEIEQQQTFQDKLLEDAQKENRDLTPEELKYFERSRDEIVKMQKEAQPVMDSARIAAQSREMLSELARIGADQVGQKPAETVEYRSAGQYVNDVWKSRSGDDAAAQRLEIYNRAAAHQLTSDNPGLIPSPIVQPVINFIDQARPMTSWFGPRDIPSGNWDRPKVTQHTNVAEQPTGEKNELVSQKMTITSTNVVARTWGGYVNVSRQNLDWSTPQIMDIVIQDLAGKYGTVTEAALGAAIKTAAPTTETVPTGAATAAQLNAALWEAAGLIYGATAGQGRLAMFVPPDQLGVWAPLFAPINPVDAISPGFSAANFGSGAMGQISGIPVFMTAGLASGSSIVASSSAVEVYESRQGALQVIEPSVLGTQVAYFGYYTWLVVETAGLAEIVKTP